MEHGAHPVTQIVGFDPPLDDHCVGDLSKSFTRYYYPLTPVLPHSSFSWWVRARKRGGRGGGEEGRRKSLRLALRESHAMSQETKSVRAHPPTITPSTDSSNLTTVTSTVNSFLCFCLSLCLCLSLSLSLCLSLSVYMCVCLCLSRGVRMSRLQRNI